jgi:hypothetical protein
VRVLGSLREDEVIALFLRAEVGSSRFASALLKVLVRDGIDRVLVDRPDLLNQHQNEYRRALLSELRGWGANCGLFAGFPAPVAWCRAALAWDEMMTVRYANLPHWLYLSGGSRRPRDAAKRFRAGHMPEIDLNFYRVIGNALSVGTAPQELIMVSSVDGGDSVLVDGHARMTALALADQPPLLQLTAIVAFTDGLQGWAGY